MFLQVEKQVETFKGTFCLYIICLYVICYFYTLYAIYAQYLCTILNADTTKLSRHLTMEQPKEREEQQTHVLQTHQQ